MLSLGVRLLAIMACILGIALCAQVSEKMRRGEEALEQQMAAQNRLTMRPKPSIRLSPKWLLRPKLRIDTSCTHTPKKFGYADGLFFDV